MKENWKKERRKTIKIKTSRRSGKALILTFYKSFYKQILIKLN